MVTVGNPTGKIDSPNTDFVPAYVDIRIIIVILIHLGMHQIELSYEGVPLPGSPFDVMVVPGCDPNRVKAFGPGLEDGPHLTPGTKTHFVVDLTGAGQGGLGLAVEGPSEAPIECQDNRDGTCTVFYTPTEPGAYAIFVRFNDTNIPSE